MAHLAHVFSLDLATLSAAHRHRLAEARRELVAIPSFLGEELTILLEAWIGRYFVDRSASLLTDETRRRAVLALIRDADRRMRQKEAAVTTVQLPQATVRRLRQFAQDTKVDSLGEAIDALLVSSRRKTTQGKKSPASNLKAQAGLFDKP